MALNSCDTSVGPAQFVLLIVALRLLQSLQQANVRIHFGSLGDRLLMLPCYHRLHYTLGIGHESPGKERDYGRGFWARQWPGLKRMVEFVQRRSS